MSNNIAEEVQKRLAFPPLQKIDPNTENARQETNEMVYPATQAAIMVAVAGLYKLTRTTEGSIKLLSSGKHAWLKDVYGDQYQSTLSNVSKYTSGSLGEIESLVDKSADTAVLVLHEELAGNLNAESVMNFMSGQRDHILVYLPAGLHLGEILHDPTIDDNTNKMEGPVSSLMHKIENIFSEGK
jgi:hypothetical protein